MTTPARPPRDAYEEAERRWITDDHRARQSARVLCDATHRFFTFILPTSAIGFLLLLAAWLAI